MNFQIVFQPNALFRLTGVPSDALTNRWTDAHSIFSGKIDSINQQLQEAGSHTDMPSIADSFIWNLIGDSRHGHQRIDKAIIKMMEYRGSISLDWMSNQCCLSTKQFKRKFHERTGVNPKTYARILRFNKAYNIRNAHPHLDWLRIAVECGYHDYQHLVRDYKDFTGLGPVDFHIVESQSPECVLGLARELYKSRDCLQP